MKKRYINDQIIVDTLENNAQEGMVLMVEQYTGLLWKVISLHLNNPEDIKECVNDTFTQFYLHRDRFDARRSSLSVYLTSLARNLARSRYRKERIRQADALPVDYAVTDSQMELAEIQADLEKALTELKDNELQIIRMKYYEGMTVQEIADSLNLPYETVKKRHQRSLSKLRHAMLIMLLILLLTLVSACAYRILVYYEIIPDFLNIGLIEKPEDTVEDDSDNKDDMRSAVPLVIDPSPPDLITEGLSDIPADYRNTESTEASSSGTDDTLPRLTWIPGYGSTEDASSLAYTLLQPVTVTNGSYTYTLDSAYYKDSMLYINITLSSDEWEKDDLSKRNLNTCLAPFQDLPNGILYYEDQCYTTSKKSIGFDTFDLRQQFDFTCIDLSDSDSNRLELSIQSFGILIPFTLTRPQEVVLDSYTSLSGQYGSLAIYPRLENGSLIIAIYPINNGDTTILRSLIYNSDTGLPEDNITVSANDGTILTGDYINPSPFSGQTYSEWDFGEVPPGDYTLHVPYLRLTASFPEDFSICVNLKELSWEDTVYQIPGGSFYIEDCTHWDVSPWETVDNLYTTIDKNSFDYWKLWLHYDSIDADCTVTGINLMEYCPFLPNVNDVEHDNYYYTMPNSSITKVYPVCTKPMAKYNNLNSIAASGTMEYFIPIDEEYYDTANFQLTGSSMGLHSISPCIYYRWNQSFDIPFHVDAIE